jgi:hypothetical protein
VCVLVIVLVIVLMMVRSCGSYVGVAERPGG